ncbi:Flavonol reductase/cinnamoyl-CoA reductase [Ceraceosorus bombacis]|uniref:Flavonol reductase/cinnamoyl-CoA reductase n=1 Tax=Ceraceosorus bombacis TaxID=401625 RepID=A0A0P1BF73_9BASI|nr:Flavonol reductase/cinnamoyl-CoA reductase [Ceraceosorus bombacis]
MRVFLTGGTGLVGRHIVPELLGAGHSVLALSRNETSHAKLKASGCSIHPGDLTNLEALKSAAADPSVDAIIHTAFDHNWSKFVASCEMDRKVIEAIGHRLAELKSSKPFVVTSGTMLITPTAGSDGRLQAGKESDAFEANSPTPRKHSEELSDALAERHGVNTITVRLSPSVHSGQEDKQGFIHIITKMCKEKGQAAYAGEGQNRWNAVHVKDAAALYRRIVEVEYAQVESGQTTFAPHPAKRAHAVGEQSVAFKDIAGAIGKKNNLPVVSLEGDAFGAHYSMFQYFVAKDNPISSQYSGDTYGWKPTQIGLLEDIEKYYPVL